MTVAKPLDCSFCRKPLQAVRILVTSDDNKAAICDRCVELAVERVDSERKRRREVRLSTHTPASA